MNFQKNIPWMNFISILYWNVDIRTYKCVIEGVSSQLYNLILNFKVSLLRMRVSFMRYMQLVTTSSMQYDSNMLELFWSEVYGFGNSSNSNHWFNNAVMALMIMMIINWEVK